MDFLLACGLPIQVIDEAEPVYMENCRIADLIAYCEGIDDPEPTFDADDQWPEETNNTIWWDLAIWDETGMIRREHLTTNQEKNLLPYLIPLAVTRSEERGKKKTRVTKSKDVKTGKSEPHRIETMIEVNRAVLSSAVSYGIPAFMNSLQVQCSLLLCGKYTTELGSSKDVTARMILDAVLACEAGDGRAEVQAFAAPSSTLRSSCFATIYEEELRCALKLGYDVESVLTMSEFDSVIVVAERRAALVKPGVRYEHVFSVMIAFVTELRLLYQLRDSLYNHAWFKSVESAIDNSIYNFRRDGSDKKLSLEDQSYLKEKCEEYLDELMTYSVPLPEDLLLEMWSRYRENSDKNGQPDPSEMSCTELIADYSRIVRSVIDDMNARVMEHVSSLITFIGNIVGHTEYSKCLENTSTAAFSTLVHRVAGEFKQTPTVRLAQNLISGQYLPLKNLNCLFLALIPNVSKEQINKFIEWINSDVLKETRECLKLEFNQLDTEKTHAAVVNEIRSCPNLNTLLNTKFDYNYKNQVIADPVTIPIPDAVITEFDTLFHMDTKKFNGEDYCSDDFVDILEKTKEAEKEVKTLFNEILNTYGENQVIAWFGNQQVEALKERPELSNETTTSHESLRYINWESINRGEPLSWHTPTTYRHHILKSSNNNIQTGASIQYGVDLLAQPHDFDFLSSIEDVYHAIQVVNVTMILCRCWEVQIFATDYWEDTYSTRLAWSIRLIKLNLQLISNLKQLNSYIKQRLMRHYRAHLLQFLALFTRSENGFNFEQSISCFLWDVDELYSEIKRIDLLEKLLLSGLSRLGEYVLSVVGVLDKQGVIAMMGAVVEDMVGKFLLPELQGTLFKYNSEALQLAIKYPDVTATDNILELLERLDSLGILSDDGLDFLANCLENRMMPIAKLKLTGLKVLPDQIRKFIKHIENKETITALEEKKSALLEIDSAPPSLDPSVRRTVRSEKLQLERDIRNLQQGPYEVIVPVETEEVVIEYNDSEDPNDESAGTTKVVKKVVDMIVASPYSPGISMDQLISLRLEDEVSCDPVMTTIIPSQLQSQDVIIKSLLKLLEDSPLPVQKCHSILWKIHFALEEQDTDNATYLFSIITRDNILLNCPVRMRIMINRLAVMLSLQHISKGSWEEAFGILLALQPNTQRLKERLGQQNTYRYKQVHSEALKLLVPPHQHIDLEDVDMLFSVCGILVDVCKISRESQQQACLRFRQQMHIKSNATPDNLRCPTQIMERLVSRSDWQKALEIFKSIKGKQFSKCVGPAIVEIEHSLKLRSAVAAIQRSVQISRYTSLEDIAECSELPLREVQRKAALLILSGYISGRLSEDNLEIINDAIGDSWSSKADRMLNLAEHIVELGESTNNGKRIQKSTPAEVFYLEPLSCMPHDIFIPPPQARVGQGKRNKAQNKDSRNSPRRQIKNRKPGNERVRRPRRKQ